MPDVSRAARWKIRHVLGATPLPGADQMPPVDVMHGVAGASPPFDPWQAFVVGADIAAAGHADAKSLERRARERLAALLESATRSPLYRPLLDGRDIDHVRLEELPSTRKDALMSRFDDWVTDPDIRLADLRDFVADRSRIGDAFLGRYTVWESSGSTGEPGLFVNDGRALAIYDALEALRRHPLRPFHRLVDPLFLNERIAFVGATGGHFASTTSMARLRRLNPLLAPRLRSLSFLQPMEALAAELEDFGPTILSTYPSAAVILAEERRAGGLHIAPREVWTGGETMTAAMRAFVRDTFECPVSNDYGCSEFLSLATECVHGQLHVNSDWAILESVDDAGRAVPAGQSGSRCLLTNLANRIQPLIRYDLGDQLRIRAGACPCGSALPAIDVRGRSDDILRLVQGRQQVALSPLALCTVLEDDAGLFDFQLVQRGPHQLELTTRLRGPAARHGLDRGRAALQGFLADRGAPGVVIRCRCAEPIRQRASGKIKRVLSVWQ
jgi:phenylacetate-coenzyme A ligase PaaK-like adenylate-forming protein